MLGHLADFSPFAMLKRLKNVHFSGRNASGLYNVERGKGYHPQGCQMSQGLLSETVAQFSRLCDKFNFRVCVTSSIFTCV